MGMSLPLDIFLVVLLCRSVPLTSGGSEEPSAVFLLAVFL
jgi:hypothetical protein